MRVTWKTSWWKSKSPEPPLPWTCVRNWANLSRSVVEMYPKKRSRRLNRDSASVRGQEENRALGWISAFSFSTERRRAESRWTDFPESSNDTATLRRIFSFFSSPSLNANDEGTNNQINVPLGFSFSISMRWRCFLKWHNRGIFRHAQKLETWTHFALIFNGKWVIHALQLNECVESRVTKMPTSWNCFVERQAITKKYKPTWKNPNLRLNENSFQACQGATAIPETICSWIKSATN